MVIEFTNCEARHAGTSAGSVAFVVSAAIFILIPISLIIIGMSSQPTGNLLSPLPEHVLSEDIPSSEADLPVIASDNSSTPSAVDASLDSNSSDHIATLSAGLSEIKVYDTEVTSDTPILITNNDGHYYIKSKSNGSFIVGTDSTSSEDRTIDYQVVTP